MDQWWIAPQLHSQPSRCRCIMTDDRPGSGDTAHSGSWGYVALYALMVHTHVYRNVSITFYIQCYTDTWLVDDLGSHSSSRDNVSDNIKLKISWRFYFNRKIEKKKKTINVIAIFTYQEMDRATRLLYDFVGEQCLIAIFIHASCLFFQEIICWNLGDVNNK